MEPDISGALRTTEPPNHRTTEPLHHRATFKPGSPETMHLMWEKTSRICTPARGPQENSPVSLGSFSLQPQFLRMQKACTEAAAS